MTPEQELREFLKQNPHLQDYQNRIQSSLLKCDSIQERLGLLFFLIRDNLVELGIEVDNLQKRLTEYDNIT